MYPRNVNITSLPLSVLKCVFSYFSYDEIAKLRQICKYFNTICSGMLNDGFRITENKVIAYHVKLRSLLPRRESERVNHPLNRHCEALSAVETRLSLLRMCILRFVSRDLCCFFPGKVLDEINTICSVISLNESGNIRPYDLLNELRDISSMAMEHFEERMLPFLKSDSSYNISWPQNASISSSCPNISPNDNHDSNNSSKPNSLKEYNSKIIGLNTLLIKQMQRIRRTVQSLVTKQREISEQNKRLDEIVRTQNERIRHLESICGIDVLRDDACQTLKSGKKRPHISRTISQEGDCKPSSDGENILEKLSKSN